MRVRDGERRRRREPGMQGEKDTKRKARGNYSED